MSKSLPANGFKWLNPKKFSLNNYKDDNLRACVLECDLDYSRWQCYLNYGFPLAPDKLEIEREKLCDCQLKFMIHIIFLVLRLKS